MREDVASTGFCSREFRRGVLGQTSDAHLRQAEFAYRCSDSIPGALPCLEARGGLTTSHRSASVMGWSPLRATAVREDVVGA
jgi:hypothetical protein